MSNQNLKIKINFGARQFIVNCNDLIYDRAVELAEKVAEIRMKTTLLSKYPMEEEETKDKWLERIGPLLEKDRLRKPGEAIEVHLKRISGAAVASHEAAFGVINAIAEVMGMPKVDLADFKSASWIAIKGFIYDVLTMADVDADEFAPKSVIK